MKTHAAAIVATLSLLSAGAAEAAGFQPFVAEFTVKYSFLSAGKTRLELKRDPAPGRWVMETRGDASFPASLVVSGTLVQTSWFAVTDDGVQPLRFRFDDASETEQEDIALDFDWQGARATGNAKGKAVDAALLPHTQDPVSYQFAMMFALQNGREPGQLPMLDGPKIKVYDHTFLRKERIKTAAGTFDTVVYKSSREGSDRETHMWLAPSLGYFTVQVEQYRKGKRLFAMYLQKYRPGD